MPKGRVVRKDERNEEKIRASGRANIDENILKAMTEENGPLAIGGVAGPKANSVEGQKKVLQMLDDDASQVKKKAKIEKEKDKGTEEVVPKTKHESEPQVHTLCPCVSGSQPTGCRTCSRRLRKRGLTA